MQEISHSLKRLTNTDVDHFISYLHTTHLQKELKKHNLWNKYAENQFKYIEI